METQLHWIFMSLRPATWSRLPESERNGKDRVSESVLLIRNPPLALISSLLSLLQLGQSSGQTLLSTIQLLLNQLDTSVKGSDISLSLGREERGVRL